ncbi:hypothetical protein FOXG_20605 [Fusarium oxysporum f. sp. lycopersici 4287]|uniref:Uncharacterized protein n=2 Tax=Fusarium oxysporum TaxID=5507 RepID=A0A0J9VLS3_FUSO4|nr:hypothetical protein FOXG_20605 [Fusarium oxysporum f. sp. lycopersici 4287]EXK29664.1 hypothetical protein FOMG_14128 [Fusarium oxysporum f. sp. melonis 26406]KNB12139.1 hypothetical protein FOXG_20605 [Fusarium oxysporum f. sp. lycopersici 4287]
MLPSKPPTSIMDKAPPAMGSNSNSSHAGGLNSCG